MGSRDASGGPTIGEPVRPVPARLTPFRTDVERTDLDIDQLFAPEPDEAAEPRRPESPTLIFTQPADRNLQQFADEPVQFADEVSAPPDPHHGTLLLPVALPYQGVWNEPDPPARRRWSFGFAALGLLGAAAVAAFLFVNGGSPADPAGGSVEPATASAGDTPTSPMSATDPPPPPAGAGPRQPSDVPVNDTAAIPSPARRREPPNTSGTAPPLPTANRDAARAAATTGRAASTGPAVSTREVTDAPGVTAPPPVPDPGVPRPGTGTAEPVGQPLTPAPDVASLAPPRSAGPAVRDPAPADTPAPVAAAPPSAALDPRIAERDRVRAVLAGYERAYNALDADAASRVFPGVDRKALSRAFSGLSAQEVRLEDCRISVLTSTATATCAGSLRWTPKVGGGSKDQARNWQFNLQQMPGGWRISSVRVQ